MQTNFGPGDGPFSPSTHKTSLLRCSTDKFKAKMNRFLPKKRSKKNAAAEATPIDLAIALPSSDNFRTSLLMSSLSTRFSMLREQDDPNSMLGKASDDSVLTPNRRSRLADFGYQPGSLAGIHDGPSLARPTYPFASSGRRLDSFSSADGCTSFDDNSLRPGSVMTRARPGEGNTLFGGRQKIYKIPIGPVSTKTVGTDANKSGMGGRVIYEDDVNTSAFQKYRLEQSRKDQEEETVRQMGQESPAKMSPSLGYYNNRRETSSSTTSGQNARTSTAATSINSQGGNPMPYSPSLMSPMSSSSMASSMDRSGYKSKRLHDQGLDKEIQDQQYSTPNSLSPIQQGRTGIAPPWMSQPKSTSNLQDRYQRALPMGRGATPSPYAVTPIVADSREIESPEYSPSYNLSDSQPLSPIGSDSEDHSSVFNNSIDPKDRGKATAMGVFKKPTHYNDAEYLRRQSTINRGGPTPNPGTATSTLPANAMKSSKPTGVAFAKPDSSSNAAALMVSRSPTGASQKSEPSAFSVFQSAASLMKKATADREPASPADNGGSLLLSPTLSDANHDRSLDMPYDQNARIVEKADIPSTQLMTEPSHDDEPALRVNIPFNSTEPVDGPSSDHDKVGFSDIVDGPHTTAESLPPQRKIATAGLSSMVRQHLRHGSDRSSIYDDVPQPLAPTNNFGASYSNGPGSTQTFASRPQASMGYSAPHQWDTPRDQPQGRDLVNPIEANAASNGLAFDSRAPSTPDYDDIPWPQQLKKQHNRGASEETAAEREAFANELQQRQRAIQEKLRNHSPHPSSPTFSKTNRLNAMSIMRSKSSRDSVADREQQYRTKKVFALGSLGRHSEDDKRVRTGKWGVPIPPDPEDGGTGYDIYDRSRDNSLSREAGQGSGLKGRSSPASTGLGMRNRSDSEVTLGARSRSRGGRYRDDLDKAMAEGTSSRTTSMYPDAYSTPEILEQHPLTPPPAMAMPQLSSPRLRSNSKTASPTMGNGQWDQFQLHPALRNGAPSPAPSPRLPAGVGMSQMNKTVSSPNLNRPPLGTLQTSSSALLGSARSPVVLGSEAYSVNTTPPVSGSATPVSPPFSNANSVQPLPQGFRNGPAPRKRSVQKSEISEPTFISTTSVVETVPLPLSASLKNGADESVPPPPPLNPRRRMFPFGRSGENSPASMMSNNSPPGREVSVFEDDGDERSRSWQRLRKAPSNWHGLNEQTRRDKEMGGAGGQRGQVLRHAVSGGSRPIMMTEGGMF